MIKDKLFDGWWTHSGWKRLHKAEMLANRALKKTYPLRIRRGIRLSIRQCLWWNIKISAAAHEIQTMREGIRIETNLVHMATSAHPGVRWAARRCYVCGEWFSGSDHRRSTCERSLPKGHWDVKYAAVRSVSRAILPCICVHTCGWSCANAVIPTKRSLSW